VKRNVNLVQFIIIQKDHDDISNLDVLIAESDVNYNDLSSIETVEI